MNCSARRRRCAACASANLSVPGARSRGRRAARLRRHTVAAAPHLFHLRDMLDARSATRSPTPRARRRRRPRRSEARAAARTATWRGSAPQRAGRPALARWRAAAVGRRRARAAAARICRSRGTRPRASSRCITTRAPTSRALSVLVYLNDGGEMVPAGTRRGRRRRRRRARDRVAALEAAARVEAAGEGGVRACPRRATPSRSTISMRAAGPTGARCTRACAQSATNGSARLVPCRGRGGRVAR